MIEEHRSLLESLLPDLNDANDDLAAQNAALPDQIRGYEGIKLASLIEFRQRVADALATIERLL